MLFTSSIFLFVFLPAFLAAYYLSPRNLIIRNYVALAGSVVFFAWGEPLFVFALFIGTLIDYRVSLVISPDSKYKNVTKRWLLMLAVALNVIALISSKYVDFIVSDIVNPLAPWLNVHLEPPHFPLLLGISFITFHRISYLVDSYKGRAIPPRGFFDCALYIFLFPQLIAGPIIRYHDIGYQIHSRIHTVDGFLAGFNRFAIGLAKKVLFADPLGILADRIFGLPIGDYSPIFAWGGAVAYSLQIYFDFSAYSDMAIGLGRMMGFNFPENFNRPYISQSITEFWRRWHISLSNWMRLYLYIPLGGNRVSKPRMYLNLWIVFIISGFWHGASWNFVVWGAYYGLFLSIEHAIAGRLGSRFEAPVILKQVTTLLIVMVGWVLFRSPSLDFALHYLGVMFGHNASIVATQPPWGTVFGNRELVTMLVASLIACVRLPGSNLSYMGGHKAFWSDAIAVDRAGASSLQFVMTLTLLIVSSAALVSAEYVPFLYFRF